MLEFDGLTYSYPGSAPPVFAGFSWMAESGSRWAVVGPSGGGKSTFLMLLAGLLRPQSGAVLVDGKPLRRPRPETGLVIQDYGLLPWATVRQNAALGLRIRQIYGPDGIHAPAVPLPAAAVDGWLGRLGLGSVAASYPSRISGGQRQRTAIARTLVLEPDVLLLDEPFSSLDAPTREELQNTVLGIAAERRLTLVTVTHSIEEALRMGEQILVLGNPPNQKAKIVSNRSDGAEVAGELRELLKGSL